MRSIEINLPYPISHNGETLGHTYVCTRRIVEGAGQSFLAILIGGKSRLGIPLVAYVYMRGNFAPARHDEVWLEAKGAGTEKVLFVSRRKPKFATHGQAESLML